MGNLLLAISLMGNVVLVAALVICRTELLHLAIESKSWKDLATHLLNE